LTKDGKSLVVKLAKDNNSDELWNDYYKHTLVAEQFSKYITDAIRTPGCYFFVPKDKRDYFEQYPGLVSAAERRRGNLQPPYQCSCHRAHSSFAVQHPDSSH
jgi:hypothetical protein